MDALYKEIGKRIRDARDALGLTQEALAKAVERVNDQPFSPVKVSYFETGARRPKLEDLRDFAIALGKPMEYFLADSGSNSPSVDMLHTVLLRATHALNPTTSRQINELVDIILHSPVREGVELELIPRKTAREILLFLNITTPQVDLKRVASASGVNIETRELDDSVSGLVVVIEGHTTIVVNKYQSLTQQRFAIAHELGHLWLGHYPSVEVVLNFNGSIGAMDPLMEHQADQFARELLMPEDWLHDHWRLYGGDLPRLAQQYGVGIQSLWVRLNELEIVKGITVQ